MTSRNDRSDLADLPYAPDLHDPTNPAREFDFALNCAKEHLRKNPGDAVMVFDDLQARFRRVCLAIADKLSEGPA